MIAIVESKKKTYVLATGDWPGDGPLRPKINSCRVKKNQTYASPGIATDECNGSLRPKIDSNCRVKKKDLRARDGRLGWFTETQKLIVIVE